MRFLFLLTFFILTHFYAGAQQVRPKWVDDLRGTGSDNSVTYIALDQQNNIYVTGQFEGTIDMDPSAGVKNLTSTGQNDVFIGKYNQDGTLIWAESIGGIGNEQPEGIAVDKDGNVSVVGTFSSATLDADPGPGVYNLVDHNTNNQTGFLVHLNTGGGFLWANALDVTDLPGQGADSFRVSVDSQDDVITTSIFGGPLTIGDSTYTPSDALNGIIVKYDPNGDISWSIYLHGTAAGEEGVEPFGAKVDNQDNILVSGSYIGTINFNPLGVASYLTAPTPTASSFVAKYSSSGSLIWINNISTSTPGYVIYETAISIDQQNNVYFTKVFLGSLNFGSVTLPSTGSKFSQCIAKYSSSGILQFAKSILGLGSISNNAIEIANDKSNNFYLTGLFSGTVNFNMNSGNAENLSAHGSQDFFVAKYDNNGNYIHGFNCGPNSSSGNYTTSNSIAIDNINNIDIGGQFNSTVNFDPTGCSADTLSATASDTYEGFFAQYNIITLGNNIITAPAITSFCSSGAPGAITGSSPTGGTVAYSYQWLTSADSVTFADINGATAQDYTPPTLTATTYYERMVSSDTCTVPTVSNIIGLHVLPALAVPVVTVAATTSSSVVFTWTAIPGAEGYQVSTDGGQTYSPVAGLADTVSNLKPGQSVTLIVQATGSISCQTSTASAAVTGKVPAGDIIYCPNAFTPNGDGRNDIWNVEGESIQSLKYSIYDQWGELLFTSTSLQNGWDGTYKGTKEPVGVYVYYVEAVMNDGQNIKKKGTINLLK